MEVEAAAGGVGWTSLVVCVVVAAAVTYALV
jgi:hypothetical protein